MTEQHSYTFKRLDASLYTDLVYISKSAFNFNPGEEYYRRKNETAAFGEPYLGYIAYSNSGEPAAFYGVYALPVEHNGAVFMAAQSGDTMTHQAHKGKGLFTELAKLTYALAKEKGIQFLYGFPNKNSRHGLVNKLNWTCPGNLKEYRLRIFTIPLARIAKKFTFLNKPYEIYTSLIFSFFKSTGNTIKNSVLEQNISGVSRTAEYVGYKSFSGCKLLTLQGSDVWLKSDAVLFLGDMDRSAAKNFPKIISKLRCLAFLLGTDSIVFYSTPGTFWDKHFANHFAAKDSLSYCYLDLGYGFPLETLQIVGADFDTF